MIDTVERVCVTVTESKSAFVWDADGVLRLRREYGIIGGLIGTLPLYPTQNKFLGLPLRLSPEEVTFLLELKAVRLVAVSKMKPLEQDFALLHEIYSKQLLVNRDRGSPTEAVNVRTTEELNDAINSLRFVTVLSGVQSLANCKNLAAVTAVTLAQAAERDIWNYPNTSEERARYKLWKTSKLKNGFMTVGFKFGGLWLAYKKDPFLAHSHSIVTPPLPNSCLLHSVAGYRLANQVRKSYVEGDSTVTWSNDLR